MLRRTLLASLALAVPVLAASGTAQEPAKARLFTRTADGIVRAAIEIEMEGAWHIYHSDLGHPNAIGQPTTVTLPEGLQWSEVRFPEPKRHDQSSVAGPGTFILVHEHEVVLYVAGKLAEGASAEGLEIKLKGLVCEDLQGCIPFRRTLTSEGPGPDELFAAFPADLVATLGGGGASGEQESGLPAITIGQEAPREDEIEKGEADTTLYVRTEGSEVRAALEIEITPGWHLYHEELGPSTFGIPTTITLHGAGVTWEAPAWPEPEKFDQSDIEKGLYILGHEGTLVVYVRGTLAPGAVSPGNGTPEVWGEIAGQTCEKVCLDYRETFVSRGRGPDALWSAWEAQHARAGRTEAGASGAPEEEKSLLLFLLAAVAGGLFALVMPCTYPMIPITISFFTKQSERRGGSALSLSLAYGAGIVLIFVLIGVVFGSLIIPFATHPVTNLVIAIAFVYFALVLFGLVNLQPPAWLMNMAGSASTRGGFVGVFLMGATLVITSFTCTAPFVGSLLSFGASEGNLVRVALGMGVFGLTMAIPFVFLSLVPARIKAMPRSGEWMNTVKVFMGFVELAAALKFFSNSDLVWNWQLLSRELFLLLWGVIFVAAALFLFGVFTRGARPGPRRLVSAGLTLLLALWCFWGMSGRKLDFVMTAIAPNYSGGRLGWEWYTPGGTWPIVKDDYDAARARAAAEGKLLLVNFTGFT
ncbi:MAG TPA: protein-disulfide reductase DsbD domain-containing protein [Planctomycetota bacterium]